MEILLETGIEHVVRPAYTEIPRLNGNTVVYEIPALGGEYSKKVAHTFGLFITRKVHGGWTELLKTLSSTIRRKHIHFVDFHCCSNRKIAHQACKIIYHTFNSFASLLVYPRQQTTHALLKCIYFILMARGM